MKDMSSCTRLNAETALKAQVDFKSAIDVFVHHCHQYLDTRTDCRSGSRIKAASTGGNPIENHYEKWHDLPPCQIPMRSQLLEIPCSSKNPPRSSGGPASEDTSANGTTKCPCFPPFCWGIVPVEMVRVKRRT